MKNIKKMYEEYSANFYGANEVPATYSPRITEAAKAAKTGWEKPVLSNDNPYIRNKP